MEIEDLILRLLTQAPFTTKGAELTMSDHDNNVIAIGQYIIALNNPGAVPAYDAATGYTGTQYVAYDSKLWKHVAAGITTGVTPGTDDTKWQRVSVGVLVHQQNKDSQLEGLVDGNIRTVTISELYNLVQQTQELKTFAVDVSSAEILQLNTTPKVLATPSAGKAIQLVSAWLEVLWNDSPVDTPYDTFTRLDILCADSVDPQAQFLTALAKVARVCKKFNETESVSNDTQVVADKDLILQAGGGDPLNGTFDIRVTGIYREITLSI